MKHRHYRPWHDARAIAHTRAITRGNQENGGLDGRLKAHPKVKLRGLISPHKILNISSRIHFDWFNRIHFKFILLTLLFKYLFFETNLNCSYALLLDLSSIITQCGFCKYVLLKKIKTDIFSKSTFWYQKIIVIIYQK